MSIVPETPLVGLIVNPSVTGLPCQISHPIALGSRGMLAVYISLSQRPLFILLVVFTQIKDDYCILVALPSSDSKLLDSHQTSCLQTGFIDYLSEKGAAGIINVPKPGGHEVRVKLAITCSVDH